MITTEEVRKNREEWVKALRSGEFRQGAGYLCQQDPDADSDDSTLHYCCLGVACEKVFKLDRKKTFRNDWKYIVEGDPEIYTIDTELLPSQCRKLGLSKKDMTTLIEMNDNRGATFEEIADFLTALPICDSFV